MPEAVAAAVDRRASKVLYITSSSYSGSTLLAFLLNTHPEIVTVGEMEGWQYKPDEEFHCSCGAILSACPFFRAIADAFARQRLPFDFRRFGTAYSLVGNDRIDRYLTASLPRVSSSSLERLRDRLVCFVPRFASRLAQQDAANVAFIRTALAYRRASVFVDACKSPYRLRHLRRIGELDLRVVHLVRDPRGVALSNVVKRGQDAALATRLWIREQLAILRIAGEFPSVTRVYYEDLCDAVDVTAAELHRFLGLAPHPVPPDFKAAEHHILGNWMRLSEVSRVSKDSRWQSQLSERDKRAVSDVAHDFMRSSPHDPLSEIIDHYLQ